MVCFLAPNRVHHSHHKGGAMKIACINVYLEVDNSEIDHMIINAEAKSYGVDVMEYGSFLIENLRLQFAFARMKRGLE